MNQSTKMPEKDILIVVHGMGDQRRNDSLLGVVRPMLELMRARGISSWQPDVEGSLGPDQQAYAEVQYRDRVMRFTEYWWAEDVRPASDWRLAWWIFRRLSAHLGSMIRNLWQALADVSESVTSWRTPKDPWAARAYHLVAIPVFLVMVTLLWVATPLLVLALVALGYARFVPGVPSFVGYFQSVLKLIAVDYLGDIQMYFRDPVQAAQIRGGLQQMIEEYAVEPGVKRIVLLAHSTGNLVVYDCLAHLRTSAPKTLERVKAFIGIGSILPMAWNDSIVGREERRFRRPIAEHIHWYHLWTRFDIGPAGPLKPPGAIQEQGPQLCNRRVSNFDDLLLDHTGYWENLEQVHSLVLEEMGGLDEANDFWRGPGQNPPGSWWSRSDQTWRDFNMRRRAVSQLAFVRLLTWPVGPVMFPLLLWFNGWAKGIADFVQLDWLANKVSFHWLVESVASENLSAVSTLGLAALLAALLSAAVYLLLYVAYKKLWWNRSLKVSRARRAMEFTQWRAAKQRQSLPSV